MDKKSYYKSISMMVVRRNFPNELKKALTHSSFYNTPTDDICSKYIFLGMFAFKGKVAEIINRYIPINGKQAQQYLGNLFKKPILELIYKRYHLHYVVRYGKTLDIAEKHHLFVYALLGFVFQYASNKQLERFVYLNFLEKTGYLLSNNAVNKDQWAKCIYLSHLYYNKKPVIKNTCIEKNQYKTAVYVDDELVAVAIGINEKYTCKKAVKIAYRKFTHQLANELESDPLYQLAEQKRKKEETQKLAFEKSERLKEYKQKQKDHAKRMAKRKAIRKKQALERDMERKQQKAKAKKRKEQQEEAHKRQKMDLANLSVAKIRHLQDKGVLKAGKPKKNKK